MFLMEEENVSIQISSSLPRIGAENIDEIAETNVSNHEENDMLSRPLASHKSENSSHLPSTLAALSFRELGIHSQSGKNLSSSSHF